MEIDSKTNSVAKKNSKLGINIHRFIDKPDSCIVKDQVEVNELKMLWICPNGEQKLINFGTPSDDCTVQDLLDAAEIPMCRDLTIALIKNDKMGINYVVNSISFSEAGSEQSIEANPDDSMTKIDSSSGFSSLQDEYCGDFPMSKNKECLKTNREQNEVLKLEEERSGSYKTRRKRNRNTAEEKYFKELKFYFGISSDEEDQSKENPKKSKVKNNNSMVTDLDNPHDETEMEVIIDKESVISDNNSISGINENDVDPEEKIKGNEVLDEVHSMLLDRSIQDPYTSLICRIVMIGSHHYTPKEKVIISQSGVTLRAPLITDGGNFVCLELKFEDILKVVIHFGEVMPVLFFYVKLSAVDMIHKSLEMNDPEGRYYHPLSKDQAHKRLAFLPKEIDEKSKLILQTLFLPNNLLQELDNKEAADLLLSAAPRNIRPEMKSWIEKLDRASPTVNNTVKNVAKTRIKKAQRLKRLSKNTNSTIDNTVKNEIKTIPKESQSSVKILAKTRLKLDNDVNRELGLVLNQYESSGTRSKELPSTIDNPVHGEIKTLLIYPPPPAKGRISISTQDYACLGESNFLNDVIIDFYLRYLSLEVLSDEDRERTHIFSIHFYKRLTSPVTDSYTQISQAKKRHSNVQKWTKNVNIFEKDFIIVPINKHAHWFLAIICFPGRVGKEQTMIEVCDTTKTKYNLRQVVKKVLKRLPCILIFDSLAGSENSAQSVISNLRDYLTYEHLVKLGTEKIFSEKTMKGARLEVPQQLNFSDCGLYVLQYVESFFSDPITDYNLPIKSLKNWFSDDVVSRKRRELANLIRRLME